MDTRASDETEELKRDVGVLGVCLLAQHYFDTYVHKTPCMTSTQTGNKWLMEVLRGHESRCYHMFRMNKEVFGRLSNDLEVNYGLMGSRSTSHTEVLGMFLHILGHGIGNRLAQERFQHSGETISRYFGQALDVVCRMAQDILKPTDPEFRSIPPKILNDRRYMPHFKDCIGAIDGVHIEASIPPHKQVPYIGRKGIPTQNVMAVCDFDMQFIFACAGWEGSAHDTRVFLSVLRDNAMNFPKPPQGKYYLVDSGYPQMNGYLGPYKGAKAHHQQYRRRQPTNSEELFNQRHSSLRSVIERTFGVWKKKWKVLKHMSSFSFDKQVKIVIATMALHNYVRRHSRLDKHFVNIGEGSGDNANGEDDAEEEGSPVTEGLEARQMEIVRNNIAQSLMTSRNV